MTMTMTMTMKRIGLRLGSVLSLALLLTHHPVAQAQTDLPPVKNIGVTQSCSDNSTKLATTAYVQSCAGGGGGGTGTVTSVSVQNVNGVSATVSNPTTTPQLTFTLGAITPANVAATGPISTTSTLSAGSTITQGSVPVCLQNGTNCPSSGSTTILSGSITLSPGSLSAGSCVTGTTTITGATVGHAVTISVHGAVPSVPAAPFGIFFASVTSTNTVTAEFCSTNSSFNFGSPQFDLSTF